MTLYFDPDEVSIRSCFRDSKKESFAQIFQNPSSKEYTLIHYEDPQYKFWVSSLIKGVWKIWVHTRVPPG